MGLSRRRFTREFKLAAVQWLEQGVSIAEVVRAMEVNLNVLHCWRKGNPWDNAACESFMASSNNSRKRTDG
jgi:transposase-like protein